MSRIVSDDRVGGRRHYSRSAYDRRLSMVTPSRGLKRYVPPAQAIPLPHKVRSFRCGDAMCLALYHFLCMSPVKLSTLRLCIRTATAQHLHAVESGRSEACSCLRLIEAMRVHAASMMVDINKVTIVDIQNLAKVVA